MGADRDCRAVPRRRHYFLVLAFRNVEISVVAPFRYHSADLVGIAGYIAFGEVPDRWSSLGAVLIVGSGLYTLHREAVRRRDLTARAAPPGRPPLRRLRQSFD